MKIEHQDNLFDTCLRGDLLSLIKSKYNKSWSVHGLKGACQGGHLMLVKLIIAKGAHHWNWGLGSACKGGQLAIAELMIMVSIVLALEVI